MNHLDLFSGIGGFAYAVDQVWPGSTHVFCDNNLFCQKVLAKHWPESLIYGDIRTITNTESRKSGEQTKRKGWENIGRGSKKRIDLLTGGFPCQPFSAAGKRRGTADDRYLWPEMLRVIRLAKPTWIIGENVGGFVTWNEGMVLEQVCTDLESEGYEVQPFIIPAVSVNAPHRRDRVWIVANRTSKRPNNGFDYRKKRYIQGDEWVAKENKPERDGRKRGVGEVDANASNSTGGQRSECLPIGKTQTRPGKQSQRDEWEQDWLEVAAKFCVLDDGLPNRVDRLKALGNAIVPQVAIEIMEAIKYANENT